MPDLPLNTKRHPPPVLHCPVAQIPYAELHCKSNFTFLEGASHADELVAQAASCGYRALAITDRHSLAGIVRAHRAAKEHGCKLLVGAEIVPIDGPPLVVWAIDRHGYGRLCRLLTTGRRRAVKGECTLTCDDVAAHSDQLLAGVITPSSGELSLPALHRLRDIFTDRCYLLAELHYGPRDSQRLEQLITKSRQTGVPLVAAGDVHYHTADRLAMQHVLTAIRQGTTVAQLGGQRLPNAERHLRTMTEIRQVFDRIPAAVGRTVELADRCSFSLEELRYEYPEELAPPGETVSQYLRRITWQGAHWRYPDGIPAKVCAALDHELDLIKELRYEAFFLTVYDAVQFARSRQILCQGRGSAANSAVCFALGVTSVDPALTDLLFERFISRERNEAPDIDVDFEHERREEVLQYIYQKYGRDRAGLAATVITYCSRSAIRDVGKALGLSLDCVDALAKQVEGYSREPRLAERCHDVGIDPESETGRQLVTLVDEIIGFPRHLSQHVGGMVITHGALCELVPIENAAMPDRTVIQWDKDDLEELGILKVDCLCLGMLSALHRSFDLLSAHAGLNLSLASIPQNDPAVYDMICRADTIGVFQIESRAQMSMLPRLKPRTYYDLVIEVAIVRPGPIQGEMVHPYLRRRCGDEQVTYPNDAIREVLEKTLGVPIFQEQAMKLAVVAAGFTPGEADQLRRAMAAWRRPGLIDQFRQKLLAGMRQRGLSEEFAERVYKQLRGFGEYGFPESHAASFALLVYASAWIKHHWPAVFAAALINSQPLGFYAPAQLIRDARDHGVAVLPVDVNHSDWDCTLEELPSHPEARGLHRPGSPHPSDQHSPQQPSLRLGLRMIGGLRQDMANVIVATRRDCLFTSLENFSRRTRLGQATITRLAEAAAFGSVELDRRQSLWEALAHERQPKSLPLFDHTESEQTHINLPAMTLQEEVVADYQTLSLSLRAHPMSFCRSQLDRLGISTAAQLTDLAHGSGVGVAGLVLLRQRPSTAKGITFVTLEDETGTVNLVVRQQIWDRYYQIARRAPAWVARGTLQSVESVIHVVVHRLEDLAGSLDALSHKSRDFR